MTYQHTQIGYPMLAVTATITAWFIWLQLESRAELPSVDSGTNLLVTGMMVVVALAIASFTWLRVQVDHTYLSIKFSFGVFQKRFLLHDIAYAKIVKNRWYHGWGIHYWWKPRMWIYNVAGFDAIELHLKNGRVYRIGTDEPKLLEQVIKSVI